jgi:hypothetical protein
MDSGRTAPGWVATARDLYLVAMAVFVVNIVIGILNGADVVEFDRNQLLTHVHAGTVGWLTLGIVASTFILFQAADRRLMLGLAILVPIYVLAFYTGNFAFRAIGGVALLIALAWLLVWVWQTFLAGERSLPRLGVVLGLTTFGYGALIGVLLQVGFAAGVTIVPGNAVGAHGASMTFGYLVLVAMALIEWRILGTRDMPRAGLVQYGALFLGGLIISISLLIGAEQAGGGIYLLTQLIAVVLFVLRIWPRSLLIDWTSGNPVRHFAASSLWVVAAMAMFMYVVFAVISSGVDPTSPEGPGNVLLASDHAAYIGIVTNIVLGLLITIVLRAEVRRSWVGQLIFWGVNVGLLIFVIGLTVNTAALKQIGAPLMGIALLASLGILAWTAFREPLDATQADLEPA